MTAGAALFAAGLGACRPARPLLVAAPPQLAVDSGYHRHPAPQLSFTYTTLWHAITAGDLGAARSLATEASERQLVDAIQSVFEGAFEQAERLVTPLLDVPDPIVRDAARMTYGAALSVQAKWGELAEFTDTLRSRHEHIQADDAGIGVWAQAFRRLRPTYIFADSSMTLPLFRSSSGAPIIDVYVNGKMMRFWLDTGASMSILSSVAAEECKITPLTADTLQLLTSIGRLAATPTVISTLQVGGLAITNTPAMIVDAKSLTIKFQVPRETRSPIRGPGPNVGLTQELRIDGIIGFDIIRRLDVTIDDPHSRVVIRQPMIRAAGARNLFWFGLPIVKLRAATGALLQFSLDTGSDETYGTQSLATKTRAKSVFAERRTVQGYGTSTTESGVVIPKVRLFLDDTPLLLERVFLYNARYPTIFDLDGTLGVDVNRGNVIRIDMTNGRFEVLAG